jgi:Cdc6-like AAA superfamily ATPase
MDVNDATGHITICKKRSHENDREVRCAYDCVFPTTATQDDVFAYVRDSVQQVAQGFNCTIFAYGQTGTGKTHTMLYVDKDAILYSTAVA